MWRLLGFTKIAAETHSDIDLANANMNGIPISLLAYSGLGILYFILWLRLPKPILASARFTGKFWLAVSLILFLIGLIKGLHFGEQYVNHLRQLAKEQGWYEARRSYQAWLIFIMLFGGFIGAGILTNRYATKLGSNIPLLIAITYLIVYQLIAVCSLHQIDAILRIRPGLLTVGNCIEGTILASVAFIGIWNLWISRKSPKPQ